MRGYNISGRRRCAVDDDVSHPRAPERRHRPFDQEVGAEDPIGHPLRPFGGTEFPAYSRAPGVLVGAEGFVVQQVAGRRDAGKPPADHRGRNPPAVGGDDLAGGVADRDDVLPDGLRYGAGNGDEPGPDVAADKPHPREEGPQEEGDGCRSSLHAEPDVGAALLREDPRVPARGDAIPEVETDAVAELPVDPAGDGGGEDGAPLHTGGAGDQ